MGTASPLHGHTQVLPDGALYIGGKRLADSSAGRQPHINPSTGKKTKDFTLAGAQEIDQAVAAARKALPAWKRLGASARRSYLLRIADVLESRLETLTKLVVIENGTPNHFAGFVGSTVPAEWFRYYAGWVDKLEGAVPPSLSGQGFQYTVHEPYGVIAALIAFNAPMGFVGMKIPAALAAGNTVVLKPSELAPWSALAFADICAEAGLPEGVVNVVPGGPEAGHALITHPGVNKVSFTGGGSTATRILAAVAPTLKPVSLELGGKSASIIYDDADLDKAAEIAIGASIAQQAGQACIAGTRVLVQRKAYKHVLERIVEIARAMRVDDPFHEDTTIGPVISEFHQLRISQIVDDISRRQDGEIVLKGERQDRDGYFLGPTVVSNVDPGSALAQDEIFGPVLALIPFDSDDEAITIANNSRYGLAGYIFTPSIDRAMRAVRDIEAGTLAVNSLNYLPVNLPFGGVKASGYGREGGYEGIAEMCQLKAVQIDFRG